MIGQFVARFDGGMFRRLTSWHLVESLVDDRAVTRCGRQMTRVTPKGELMVADEATPKCRYCAPMGKSDKEEPR